jgi:hypothetical protein
MVVPGLLVYLTLNPAILNYSAESLYIGSPSWLSVFHSIADASFSDSALLPALSGWIAVQIIPIAIRAIALLLVGVATLNLLWLPHQKSAAEWNTSLKMALLICSVLAMTIVGHSMLRCLTSLLLPMDRTAIYFVPLITLLVGFSIDHFSIKPLQGHVRWIGQAAMVLTVLFFASCLRLDYFWIWKYDAASAAIVNRLCDSGAADKRISINWMLAPSLNFYGSVHLAHLHLMSRGDFDESAPTFVLIYEMDKPFIKYHSLKIAYHDPLSDAVICVRSQN